ncbi:MULTISPECIES: hypothetical protein [Tsukamurella]|uniref:Helix-turn-helix domain-containing protein n=2 Tax=Tsukamurella TaxID=2060 RepID=A0A3P8KKM2_TSUPA|nr:MULTISPECIES: hypothetical protein [Tsukamurella]NKY18162.1 hypothetical protein [Tsukamurella spumae]UEA84017.1 hypothetical protein LK411_04045 [Tsukamurella paurometabola]VDR41178.1 Uncharacterised protein [Tsukamurella paurometabola]
MSSTAPTEAAKSALPVYETMAEVTARTKLSRDFFMNRVADGSLRAFRAGPSSRAPIRFRPEDIDGLMRRYDPETVPEAFTGPRQ